MEFRFGKSVIFGELFLRKSYTFLRKSQNACAKCGTIPSFFIWVTIKYMYVTVRKNVLPCIIFFLYYLGDYKVLMNLPCIYL
jgi:hypothetical protein